MFIQEYLPSTDPRGAAQPTNPSSRLAFASAIVVVFGVLPPLLLCQSSECKLLGMLWALYLIRKALGRDICITGFHRVWAELFGPAAGLTKFGKAPFERPCQS